MQGAPDEMTIYIGYAMMNDTLKGCFLDCVDKFNAPELDNTEKSCLRNCATKSFASMHILNDIQKKME